ncbi:hypothetical protein [Paenibacillus sp. FJAT-26967]|nr:hypothetical protein [Paenibacillus sp. FJAT-26967]
MSDDDGKYLINLIILFVIVFGFIAGIGTDGEGGDSETVIV